MKKQLFALPFMRVKKCKSGIDKRIKNTSSLLNMTLDHLESLVNYSTEITGVSTGFIDLDKKTSGLQRSDLVILAARPSMGKTTLAINICQNALLSEDKPVLVLSAELTGHQIMMRMLASISSVDLFKIRTARLSDDEWQQISDAMHTLKNTNNLYVNDSNFLTASDIRETAVELTNKHGGLGLIIVDYLQLIRFPDSKNGTFETWEVTRALKALALDLNVPVLALSQLNRGIEKRQDKRPINSDIQGSGAIENIADLIMFVYRDEVYNENSLDKGIAEIIIGKHKNGPVGTSRLAFQGQYTRFVDIMEPR